MGNKKVDSQILEVIRTAGEKVEIPDSIKPEQIKRKLENLPEKEREDNSICKNEFRKKRLTYSKALAVAASVCVVVGCTVIAAKSGWIDLAKNESEDIRETELNYTDGQDEIVEAVDTLYDADESGKGYRTVTYEEVYASMSQVWKESEAYLYSNDMGPYPIAEEGVDADEKESVRFESAADDSTLSAGASMNSVMMDAAENPMASEKSYGATNVQTVGVDEGDIVKNDGRFLYQIVDSGSGKQSIQIVDTKGGLKELSDFGDFQGITEFYVWKDLIIIIENKYLEQTYAAKSESGMIGCYDLMYHENCYHQISIYDISDRSMPKEQKVFTLQGRYMSSRIADGYFYGFSRYYANPGNGEEDYDSYIPKLDGKHLEEECIVLPKKSDGTSYLVMVSINLNEPSDFADTLGIVSDSDRYYVSSNNIYVTYGKYEQADEEGWRADQTSILRFAYEEGKMTLEAEGSINGYINDTFALDEYENHLRVVTTVQENYWKQIKDDRTGASLGMGVEDIRQTNALYVLDDSLTVVGKIEGLAEDEQIYSARFFGDTGYFVTFRQTDPLFAVDLTDPTNPAVLSELKVSGFSEYLHFYGEDCLFGFGMEADEETGWQEGLKLSMFDISNPADVQEVSRYHMSEYYYSEVLYNHHAILIHPSANIIGFHAEGNRDDEYVQEYLIFAYENDDFVEKMKIDTKPEDYGYYNIRGTFIENMFYLLRGDGRVESYDLNTGAQIEVLENKTE